MFNKFKKRVKEPTELPTVLQPEDPVNYSSVLDYLVGLSKDDYQKMIKVTGVYRDANHKAAGILDVEDQPTSTLKTDEPTDDEVDSVLDGMLEADPADLQAAILADEPPKPTKPQAPSKETKIEIK